MGFHRYAVVPVIGRFLPMPICVVLMLAICLATPVAHGAELTLEEAWQRAEQVHPELRAALAEVLAAEGELKDAHAPLWHNPEVSTELASRSLPAPAGRAREWGIGIEQTFETAGKRSYRRQAADLRLAGLRDLFGEVRRQVRAELEQRFFRVLGLQSQLRVESEALKLAEEAADAVDRRVKAGEDTRLDGNLARVEADRMRNQTARLSEELTEARAALAAFVLLPAEELPQAVGALERSNALSLERLLDSARSRPLLSALARQEEAARARVRLEQASVYPDVTVGLGVSKEGAADARERITSLGFSLPLPLFRRNTGGIARAASDLSRVGIEREAVSRDIPARIRELWIRRESLRNRVELLESSVLPKLEENQRLSLVSYRAGAIGILELLLANRQVVEGRRDAIEAATELSTVESQVKGAAGWFPELGANPSPSR